MEFYTIFNKIELIKNLIDLKFKYKDFEKIKIIIKNIVENNP